MPEITNNMTQVGNELGRLLTQYAQKVGRDVDEVTREQANDLRTDIIIGWPVDTFASRGGFQGPTKVGHAHYKIENFFPYATVIEYGGYPGVGPKTSAQPAQLLPGGIQINDGIYPTQRPAAPVRRALSKRVLALRKALEDVIT